MTDQVFLITGASTGIGAETAHEAVRRGYRVVLAARSTDKLNQLADELGGPTHALALSCDVSSWEDQEALAKHTLEHFGRIDVVFANAGFGAKRGFLNETPEHWKNMVLTNVLGAAYTIRATLPHIREQQGHFLLTGSVAGRRALPGSLYSATKWSITGMGEALRQELNGTGVRVTVLEPGMVETPFFDSPVKNALQASDITQAVFYALTQPKHVDVNEILIRPTTQEL